MAPDEVVVDALVVLILGRLEIISILGARAPSFFFSELKDPTDPNNDGNIQS